jgi:hypothetical protein
MGQFYQTPSEGGPPLDEDWYRNEGQGTSVKNSTAVGEVLCRGVQGMGREETGGGRGEPIQTTGEKAWHSVYSVVREDIAQSVLRLK